MLQTLNGTPVAHMPFEDLPHCLTTCALSAALSRVCFSVSLAPLSPLSHSPPLTCLSVGLSAPPLLPSGRCRPLHLGFSAPVEDDDSAAAAPPSANTHRDRESTHRMLSPRRQTARDRERHREVQSDRESSHRNAFSARAAPRENILSRPHTVHAHRERQRETERACSAVEAAMEVAVAHEREGDREGDREGEGGSQGELLIVQHVPRPPPRRAQQPTDSL